MLWQVLGAALWHLGDHDAARTALETASALVPLKPLGQRLLAECYALAGKPRLAVMMYRHLVRGRKCPSELLPGIAASLNKLGRLRLALAACRVLARRHPDHHQAHFGVAFYLNRLGAHPRRLIGPLTRAMTAAPHLCHYRLNLAFARAAAGDVEIAGRLLAEVRPATIFCAAWLRKMHAIFEGCGRSQLADQCTHQLDRLANGSCPLD